MAVTEFGEAAKRRGFIDPDTGDAGFIRTYRALTDSKDDNSAVVLAHPALPPAGDPYPNFPAATRRRAEAVQVDEDLFTFWEITVEYSTARIGGGVTPNPLDLAAQVSWNFEQFSRPVTCGFFLGTTELDCDGATVLNQAGAHAAITNSALDLFTDPAPEMDDSRPVCSIRRNLLLVPVWLLDYQDAVNLDAFVLDGVPIGRRRAKIRNVAVGPTQFQAGIFFREVSVEIVLRREGWDLHLLDHGYAQLVQVAGVPGQPPSTKKLVIHDADGEKLPGQTLLDGLGGKLPNGGVPRWRHYRVYKELPYGPLGILL